MQPLTAAVHTQVDVAIPPDLQVHPQVRVTLVYRGAGLVLSTELVDDRILCQLGEVVGVAKPLPRIDDVDKECAFRKHPFAPVRRPQAVVQLLLLVHPKGVDIDEYP